MKYSILFNVILLTNFIFGQDIEYNFHVEQIIKETPESEDESMNILFFNFDKQGNLLGIQNILRSIVPIVGEIGKNTKVIRNEYDEFERKTNSVISFIDTLGKLHYPEKVTYIYEDQKLTREVYEIGIDSVMQIRNIEYLEGDKRVKIVEYNTVIDYKLNQFEFGQFDTLEYDFTWESDSLCLIEKCCPSWKVKINIGQNSTVIQEYNKGAVTLEIKRIFDLKGRVQEVRIEDFGKSSYSRNNYLVNYDKFGIITNIYGKGETRSGGYIFESNGERFEVKLTTINPSKLTGKAIKRINSNILFHLIREFEIYENILPLMTIE